MLLHVILNTQLNNYWTLILCLWLVGKITFYRFLLKLQRLLGNYWENTNIFLSKRQILNYIKGIKFLVFSTPNLCLHRIPSPPNYVYGKYIRSRSNKCIQCVALVLVHCDVIIFISFSRFLPLKRTFLRYNNYYF